MPDSRRQLLAAAVLRPGHAHRSRGRPPFLAVYVQPDGRVVRPDQGADTVSEGQAYGMLQPQAQYRPDAQRTIA